MARHRAAHGSGDPSDTGSPETGPEQTADQTSDEDTGTEVAGDSGATDVSADEVAAVTDADDADDETDDEDEVEVERSPEADSFWSDVRIDPIEIALPSGVGYTLRAYRNDDELTPVDGDEPADDEDAGGADVEDAGTAAATRDASSEGKDTEGEDTEGKAPRQDTDGEDTEDRDAVEDDEPEDGSDEDEDEEPEEIPVFLAQRGKVLLFRSPESLVAFVRSDQQHAMRGLDTADDLAARIESSYLVPTQEDRYELDLLVGNLRGGHDSWEPELIISAGELARDVAYAVGLDSVLTSLSPGSPLDDLDEAMRGAARGGFGAFRARRKMRKIGAQQAALGWRTIIGKISGAVDWRD